jgi:hypothetical protein
MGISSLTDPPDVARYDLLRSDCWQEFFMFYEPKRVISRCDPI